MKGASLRSAALVASVCKTLGSPGPSPELGCTAAWMRTGRPEVPLDRGLIADSDCSPSQRLRGRLAAFEPSAAKLVLHRLLSDEFVLGIDIAPNSTVTTHAGRSGQPFYVGGSRATRRQHVHLAAHRRS